jgi:hypothetical protein
MGKNTQQRQEFIINNLRVEKDQAEGKEQVVSEEGENEQIDIAS